LIGIETVFYIVLLILNLCGIAGKSKFDVGTCFRFYGKMVSCLIFLLDN